MPSPFGGINMLGQAMRVFQRGLEVTGHNISNVNTTGYSRQRMQLGAANAETYFGVNRYQVGTGVTIQTVSRIRNQFLDRQMNNAQSDLARYQTLADNLKQVESVFPEPGDQGISNALGKFFDAWSNLSSNPNDSAAQLAVQAAGQTLTLRVRNTYGSLVDQSTQAQAQMANTFDEIDGLSKQIADLNKQIVAQGAGGGAPNDLLDARDNAVEQLSQLIGIQTSVGENGMMTVSAGEMMLVAGTDNVAIPRTFDAATQTLQSNGHSYNVSGGQLAGVMQGIVKIDSYRSQLNDFANQLKSQINTLHRTGKTSSGATGIDFFADSNPQTGAADFDLSASVKADPAQIVSGTSGTAGDGGLALSLSRMRDATLPALGGRSFGHYYSDLVGAVGRDSSTFQSAVDTQGALVSQIQNQRQAEMGVNLDDEMTNMMQYQRSYQAAAHALTVMSDVSQDMINIIR